MDSINKWAAGASYGPVLSQTDLYLLQTDLELHPILQGKQGNFTLVFNIMSGHTGGYNTESRDRDLPFAAKDEPATMPRVSQLIIITEHSPWCTIVKNERGVTMHDICQKVWSECVRPSAVIPGFLKGSNGAALGVGSYADHNVTDAEFASIPPRLQEQIKRIAANYNAANAPAGPYAGYYTPAVPPPQLKRVNWLREKVYFEALHRNDAYAISRLGFKAPNIFVMLLSG
ncbi:hypothetical protein D9615_002008 [Tricholomella constricta]|uniref:DUF6699 domain-containing protein n=1 Tax=Tricholomella constricta TaxID=117010 RepID=A0A8H5MAR6_9AGAR|nr:hypothetical protein D9615_002008 [Tricholomella constricta]